MTGQTATSELESSVRQLRISERPPELEPIRSIIKQMTSASKPKTKKKPSVADSWEDELESSDEQPKTPCAASGDESPDYSSTPSMVAEGPLDPPPTPASPQTSQPRSTTTRWVPLYGPSSSPTRPASSGRGSPTGPVRRPEKQTAVAERLIAGALGIRAPKRTEEQRAYDRAMKEREMRRRSREKEEAAREKEEEDRLKAAVWND